MLSLTNKFLICGILSEISIGLYATHIRVKLSVVVHQQTITIQQTVNRRWDEKQYNELCDMIHLFKPRIDGHVMKNGVEKIYMIKQDKSPSRLLISGNCNEWHENIYFNGQYIRLEPNGEDFVSIEIDGQWVDNGVFLNVLNDSPVVFHFVNVNNEINDGIYRLNLSYNSGYSVCENVVFTNSDGLFIQSCNRISDQLSQDKINKLMLEYDIIKD